MEHKQEIREITQILKEIKEKAPKKYEQIKKEILTKYAEISYIDSLLRISKEIDD